MENNISRKGHSQKKKGRKQKSVRDHQDEPHMRLQHEQNDNSSSDTPGRSPVSVPMSPGSSFYASDPLQGSARVIKDHCADWHNHILKWDALNDKGFSTANKIINLILQSRETEETEVASMKSMDTGIDGESQGIVGGCTLPDGIEELCNEFTEIHKSMVKLVTKMTAITTHFKGICALELQTSSASIDEPLPLFKTWPVEYFYESSMELQEMYSKELDVKRTIVQDIAHNKNRDILMTYISTWQHQPYIEDRATTILESMLQESGHR